jgi:ribosomal RNA-processing protein 12
MADLSQVLARIRPHTTSSLENQKAPAILLQALESTFQEQKTDSSPTAYFAALLTTLESTLQTQRSPGPSFAEGDVLPAELYLLSLVVPFVPQPVLRLNLTTILSLTAPMFPALVPHAPPLRSQLTIYNSVFLALDRSQLDVQGVRQAFASILQLSLDPRPKVRKKAADLVRDVLASPPTPLTRHPYAERVAQFIISNLSQINTSLMLKGRGKDLLTDGTETGIHLLAFLGPMVLTLPPPVCPCHHFTPETV